VQALGATAYLALPIKFSSGAMSGLSFVTDGPDGFSPSQIQLLQDLLPAFSVCFEIFSATHVRRSLLRAYLGAEPGELVQAGHVRPGDVRAIEAAILFTDIRGFTDLSARMDSRALIDTLNAYFGAITPPLEEFGGEILKFIGDALLVVFPVRTDRTATEACSSALRASIAADERLGRWNAKREAEGLTPLDHGFGLHMGTAEYGNIGSSQRLDFTVIGRDVNIASRVEGMCGRLGRRLIVSMDFAQHLEDAQWISRPSMRCTLIT
jgi:adenylate cyclase